MKETVINLQARCMRDNFVFSGMLERTQKKLLKNFIQTHLKLPEDTMKNISFDIVYCL